MRRSIALTKTKPTSWFAIAVDAAVRQLKSWYPKALKKYIICPAAYLAGPDRWQNKKRYKDQPSGQLTYRGTGWSSVWFGRNNPFQAEINPGIFVIGHHDGRGQSPWNRRHDQHAGGSGIVNLIQDIDVFRVAPFIRKTSWQIPPLLSMMPSVKRPLPSNRSAWPCFEPVLLSFITSWIIRQSWERLETRLFVALVLVGFDRNHGSRFVFTISGYFTMTNRLPGEIYPDRRYGGHRSENRFCQTHSDRSERVFVWVIGFCHSNIAGTWVVENHIKAGYTKNLMVWQDIFL